MLSKKLQLIKVKFLIGNLQLKKLILVACWRRLPVKSDPDINDSNGNINSKIIPIDKSKDTNIDIDLKKASIIDPEWFNTFSSIQSSFMYDAY